MKLILASASPRRFDLMTRMGLTFSVAESGAEDGVLRESDPAKYALAQAELKAGDVARRFPECAVIAADTVVSIGAHILGKPRDETDAKRMLSLLSDKTHTVYTALVVKTPSRTLSRVSGTDVAFAKMTQDEIAWYVETGEPMDKAGAYGIQDFGMRFIKSINGCYFTVVGLPVRDLYELLTELDVPIS